MDAWVVGRWTCRWLGRWVGGQIKEHPKVWMKSQTGPNHMALDVTSLMPRLLFFPAKP